ncbi:MAG: HAD-IA family hydrolase [bacterium]|nr:HAD-IA family hydrolase [bacterium]
MIAAVIFDLNGVFIQSPKLSDRFREAFGVAESEFMPALKAALTAARLPNGPSVYDTMRPHFDTWKLSLSRESFFEFWFSGEHEVPEMIALARELRTQGLRVLILSNNFRERSQYYSGFQHINDAVNHVYYSWETGYVKSDPRAFQYVLDHEQLTPDACAFFDDTDENVRVAAGLGIHAFLFRGVEATRVQLRECGVRAVSDRD